MISRSSFISNGRSGAARATTTSGERKKQILQAGVGPRCAHTQFAERTERDDAPLAQKQEPIAHALRIRQLMNGKDKCAAIGSERAQQLHDVAGLPEIETVERLVHQQKWLGRKQAERQHKPASITLR